MYQVLKKKALKKLHSYFFNKIILICPTMHQNDVISAGQNRDISIYYYLRQIQTDFHN